MNDLPIFVSPTYPVLFTLHEPEFPDGEVPAELSLAVLVGGIPSFLATIPVDREIVGEITESLRSGDVRVTLEGFSVGDAEVHPGDPPVDGSAGALLGLQCHDGRDLAVARIVSRSPKATPESVARYVLRQITKGVQIPDLASAGSPPDLF
jgi:hypothetical protein